MVLVLSIIIIAVIAILLGYVIAKAKLFQFSLIPDVGSIVVARLRPPTRKHPPSKFDSVLSWGVVFAVLAYLALSALSVYFPTTDDTKFSRGDAVTLSASDKNNAGEMPASCRISIVNGKPSVSCERAEDKWAEARSISSETGVFFPETARVDDDFRVVLEFASTQSSSRPADISATLFAPKSIEGRTAEICSGEKAGSLRACVDAKKAVLPVRFSWSLTPTQTGRALIELKSTLFDVPKSTGATPLFVTVRNGTETKQFDSQTRYSHVGETIVDFDNKTISFPVEIITTLGVTQSTYDWAKVGGAVIAGLGTLLGAGFVLRPFSKGRAEAPEPTESEGKSETSEGREKKSKESAEAADREKDADNNDDG
jgi:hypothetical protein